MNEFYSFQKCSRNHLMPGFLLAFSKFAVHGLRARYMMVLTGIKLQRTEDFPSISPYGIATFLTDAR